MTTTKTLIAQIRADPEHCWGNRHTCCDGPHGHVWWIFDSVYYKSDFGGFTGFNNGPRSRESARIWREYAKYD